MILSGYCFCSVFSFYCFANFIHIVECSKSRLKIFFRDFRFINWIKFQYFYRQKSFTEATYCSDDIPSSINQWQRYSSFVGKWVYCLEYCHHHPVIRMSNIIHSHKQPGQGAFDRCCTVPMHRSRDLVVRLQIKCHIPSRNRFSTIHAISWFHIDKLVSYQKHISSS